MKERLANEALRILSDPMLMAFFKHQIEECQEAFRLLPMGAGLEAYQTIQHDLLAVDRLQVYLKTFIEEYETARRVEGIKVADGI